MVSDNDIRLAQSGSAEAFERLYSETVKKAYFVVKRILVGYPEEEVEDVLQDAYIAVYNNLASYSSGNFQGWVDVIAANRAKNFLKKKKPVLFTEMESDDPDAKELEFEDTSIEFQPEEQVDYSETKRLVMEIIDGLPEEQRLSVVLYYFDEMSVKDIALACECSENTVKSRLNYARKSIKTKVEDLEKKGTKLYCLPIIPFLYWLLRQEFLATKVPATTLSMSGVKGKLAGGQATNNVGTAAAAVAKKKGLSVVVKSIIGVIAAGGVIGGAVGGGIALYNANSGDSQLIDDSKDSEHDSATEAETEAENTPMYTVELKEESAHDGKWNYSYIEISGWDADMQSYWNGIFQPVLDDEYLEYYSSTAEIIAQNDKLLSIRSKGSEQWEGTMHPYGFYDTHNINMETGDEYALTDLVDVDKYCEAIEAGEYTTDFTSGVEDNVLDEIFQINSSSISGTGSIKDKIGAIITNMERSDATIWNVHDDGTVDIFFMVTHAAGDYVRLSVANVTK